MTAALKNDDKAPLVPHFHASLQLGLCLGPVDAITRIRLGDKTLWEGRITQSGTINITDKDNLFGGILKEGGAGGGITFLFGEDHQLLPWELAKKVLSEAAGKRILHNKEINKFQQIGIVNTPTDPTQHFAYRGLTSIFFHRAVNRKFLYPAPLLKSVRAGALSSQNADYMNLLTARNNAQVQLDYYNGITFALFDSKSRVSRIRKARALWQNWVNYYNARIATINELSNQSGWFEPLQYEGTPGFWFSTNSPQFRDIAVRVQHYPRGNSPFGRIPRGATYDANPAYIIEDLITNRDQGGNFPFALIDNESVEIAAKQLFDDGLGLTMTYTAQAKISDQVNEVLGHIGGILYPDSRAGLMRLRLLRKDDYDTNDPTLPFAHHGNSVIRKFERKREDLTNQITTTFTNPANYEEDSLTLQDNSAAASEQGIINDDRNYYGVHSLEQARKLAERELRAGAAPLADIDIDLFREFWTLSPGDVVRVQSPEDQESDLFMRVAIIEDAADGTGMLKAKLVEDIYSLSLPPVFTESPATYFDFTALPTDDINIQSFTLPYFIESRGGIYGEFDEAHIGVLVDTDQINLYTYQIAVAGTSYLDNPEETTRPLAQIVARGQLPRDIPEEITTTLVLNRDLSNGPNIAQDGMLLIGAMADDTGELAGVKSVSETDEDGNFTIVLWRGILDTIPQAWAEGVDFWFLPRTAKFYDPAPVPVGVAQPFYIEPINNVGTLPHDNNPMLLHTHTPNSRAHQPLRPANVRAKKSSQSGAGNLFSDVIVRPPIDSVIISWDNRNRTLEDGSILPWDSIPDKAAGTVAGEVGQETIVEMYNDPLPDDSDAQKLAKRIFRRTFPTELNSPRTTEFSVDDFSTYARVCIEVFAQITRTRTDISDRGVSNPITETFTSLNKSVIEVVSSDNFAFGESFDISFGD